jgi:aldose 1-epimerase
MKTDPFRTQIDGRETALYTLSNDSGMRCQITNYGGRIVSIHIPDKHGIPGDVVLGFHGIEDYMADQKNYFGALVGRVANRTGLGEFMLDGKVYALSKNDGNNHIHGGKSGFHNRVWHTEKADQKQLVISTLLEDGLDGYPGNLSVVVTYLLTNENALEIHYRAETDHPTPANFTNHAYFNLGGGDTITDHVAQISASRYTPIDGEFLPTGRLESVYGTPFDFTAPRRVGRDIDAPNEQLQIARGYDHNFVVDGEGLRLAARVFHPESGRFMEVISDLPGMQFYTGNFLDGSVRGKGGVAYAFRSGFCCESQHFPDSLNLPEFPSIILKPGKIYQATSIYRFGIMPE